MKMCDCDDHLPYAHVYINCGAVVASCAEIPSLTSLITEGSTDNGRYSFMQRVVT